MQEREATAKENLRAKRKMKKKENSLFSKKLHLRK